MIDEENLFIQVIPWPLRECLAYTHTHTNRWGGGGGRQIDRKLYFKNTHTIKEAFH